MEDKNLVYSLHDIMGDRFARYSKYIIQERALPDVRDGLKPVQRRILYAMYKDGNTFTRPHRKSAKTVGNVIGNYHPHGDTSVYDAMVRMSQWWKNNEILIDMHGNNGSIDNDPAAAMRYTEARLSKIANELLKDIEKDTVNMVYNFDDTMLEPTVLPARFPALLVNGAKGIAAGYATEIPPHNLSEVINAAIYRLKNPSCMLEEIMEFIKGPDFPTGGIVQGKEGIKDAFATGRGKCVIKSKCEIKESKKMYQIIVSEIPYEVVKSDLVRSIDQIAFDKKIDGIIEVRDESDKEGLRIAIDIKRDADPELILNYLMKNTSLQINYNYNMVVINNNRPMQLGVLELIDAYNAHQIEVDTKRCQFDLDKAKDRLHIIDGLIIAVDNLDEVIAIIRKSKNKSDSKDNLISRYSISEKQAEAIVSLQLYRLSSTDVDLLVNEKEELVKQVEELKELLSDEGKLRKLVIRELTEIRKTYDSPRLSALEEEIDEIVIDKKDMITKEEVMVSFTRRGYAKRSSLKSYNATQDQLPNVKDDDILVGVTSAMTTDVLLLFTTLGNYIYIPVFELAEGKWKDDGEHINNIATLSSNEFIVGGILVSEFNSDVNIILATHKGLIKKTSLSEFEVQRYTKTYKCAKVDKEDDYLIGVGFGDGDSEIIIATDQGYAVKYHEEEVSPIGVKAAGVKSISNLKRYGNPIGMAVLHKNNTKNTYLVSRQGGFKVINPDSIDTTGRLNKPTSIFKCFKSDPHEAVYFGLVNEGEKAFALSTNNLIELDLGEKPSPLERNMKNNLQIANNEQIITASSNHVDIVGNNTFIYRPSVSIGTSSIDTPKKNDTKETDYEKISILDLLDDDF